MGVVTMSMHKLTAGSGYDYLTRQVAVQDATEKGHQGLASYYEAKGESPGVWIGSGVAELGGIQAGDQVTAEHMQALFGSGHHPLAGQRRRDLEAAGSSDQEIREATRLGLPYPVFEAKPNEFRVELARRFQEATAAAGLSGDGALSVQERARIRSQVGREFFAREFGRDPVDERELSGLVARLSRQESTAVAGFDLTFSPVKSVSVLWAVADPQVAAKVEAAHQAAVAEALDYLEREALYSRTGKGGVRQVDVQGMVATAFTHRDSRAGDPDLHTHVAVANKVQTADGKWLSIDGRVLYKAAVSASERYNSALEKHLADTVGVQFAERPGTDPGKRAVREVVGVDERLSAVWSARRAAITARRQVLVRDFQQAHGRPPTAVESVRLAQQATLETREAKKEPRSLSEQRAAWADQARAVLGGDEQVEAMVAAATGREAAAGTDLTGQVVESVAASVLQVMEQSRSTWQVWHVRAEAERQIRALPLASGDGEQAVEQVTRAVLDGGSVPLRRPGQHVGEGRSGDGLVEPEQLRRRDGSSVYAVAGAQQYTSRRVLDAEARIVDAATRTGGRVVSEKDVDLALLEAHANGVTLNAGQGELVRRMATSGARVQLAIAPAGSGKTTAMRALTRSWTSAGGTVVGLAPSAAAAAALREQVDATTDTLAKLVHALSEHERPAWVDDVDERTLIVIDEAGMADTPSLDTVIDYALQRGASVRLIGDDQQLAAVGAGGVLRDLDATVGAVRLRELMRFTDPAESAASLALRQGRPEALGFYLDNGRVHVADTATLVEDVLQAWAHDRGQGLETIMLAPTRELVADLNHRAREHRLDGAPEPPAAVTLADGNHASVGDLVITRTNDRRLRTSATDWVKNGDRWTVLAVGDDGTLDVQHRDHHRIITLPATYVTASTELGYATTIHAAQGVSVDTMHGIVTGNESRQAFYTMMTRGKSANHAYVTLGGDGDPHTLTHPDTLTPPTATDVLEDVLARDGAPTSATTALRDLDDPATLLTQATTRYTDAVTAAAEDLLGPDRLARLTAGAETIVPGITTEPAWPALQAHLLLVKANGTDALQRLHAAATSRPLDDAVDKAALLDWRMDPRGTRNTPPGPLPWLHGIPTTLRDHDQWGPYLHDRAQLVADLAEAVRTRALDQDDTPTWMPPTTARPPAATIADLQVWRASTGVADSDRRPTGPRQASALAHRCQRDLDTRLKNLDATTTPTGKRLHQQVTTLAAQTAQDPYLPHLVQALHTLERRGIDITTHLTDTVNEAPLPDDHAAAAIWWRLTRTHDLTTPPPDHTPQPDHTPLPDEPPFLEEPPFLDESPFPEQQPKNVPMPAGPPAPTPRADPPQPVDPLIRWQDAAARIDVRLPDEPDWPALAGMLERAHQAGIDVPDLLAHATTGPKLGRRPAQDLRYRLAATLPREVTAATPTVAGPAQTVTTRRPGPHPQPLAGPDLDHGPQR